MLLDFKYMYNVIFLRESPNFAILKHFEVINKVAITFALCKYPFCEWMTWCFSANSQPIT